MASGQGAEQEGARMTLAWQREHPEQRIRELAAEREYHLLALERTEEAIRKQWELIE